MAFDEFHFHYRRDLPLWERIGHPLDTLSVFICLILASQSSPSASHLLAYTILALFSCVLITKDEFVHTRLCSAGENWLHSILFVLHPICLLATAVIWEEGTAQKVLTAQTGVLGLYMIYQITYWNFIWKPKSTPKSTTA